MFTFSRQSRPFLVVLALLVWPRTVMAAELQLLMVEQAGCQYCARWDAEVAPEYPLTEEGRAAPLRRIGLRDPLPDDLHLARPVNFTPTFILLSDGAETDRIEGYPGEDFFWPLLGAMIRKAASP